MELFIGRIATEMDIDCLRDDNDDPAGNVLEWGTYVSTNQDDVVKQMVDAVISDLTNVDDYADVKLRNIDLSHNLITFAAIGHDGVEAEVKASFSVVRHELAAPAAPTIDPATIVPFVVTEENVDAVHTHLEGSIEVMQDDGDTTSDRYVACSQAFNASLDQHSFPHTINIPHWLSEELDEAIEEIHCD